MPFQQVPPDPVLSAFEMAMATQPFLGETANGDALFAETGREDGAMLLLLVDVTHHGPSTVPTMNALHVSLGDAFYQNRRPADLLQWLHDALAPQSDVTGNYVAAMATWVDPHHRDAIAANAGQPEPYVRRPGMAWQVWNVPAGMWLGVVEGGVPYDEATTPLASGDSLLAFTDGITEAGAHTPGVAQFQHGGLAAFLTDLPEEEPVEVVGGLMTALSDHVGATWPDDDTTAFCLRRR